MSESNRFILFQDDSTTYYDDLNQVSENIKKYKDICKFWMVISRPPDDKDHGFWCGDNVGIIFFIKRFNGDTYKI